MKLGYFQLHIFKENESEQHVYQATDQQKNPWAWNSYNFDVHNKENLNARWVKVEKPRSGRYQVRWDTSGLLYGEPGITTIDTETLNTLINTTVEIPTGITATSSRPQPVEGLTSGVALREMQNREQLTQRFPTHEDHIRAQREEMYRRYDREMERRAEQRRAEQLRLEEERSRPLRPWDRIRNFFD